MKCAKCNGACIKSGYQKNGKQRYLCKGCGFRQQEEYQYKACKSSTQQLFKKLLREGVCIRGLSRVLEVSPTTLIRWIRSFKRLNPHSFISNDEYEIDELYTFVGKKSREMWVMYAISRTTGKIIDLIVGPRTRVNLKLIVDKLMMLNPKKIYTDNLLTFKTLIPKYLHERGKRKNQKIERKNLNLRKDLSRLSRRTICYSKQRDMLEAHLRFYFWYDQLLTVPAMVS